jgi:hypothetical protein
MTTSCLTLELTKLIDETDDTAMLLFNISKKGFEFFFELASNTCTGKQGSEIEGQNSLRMKRL